MKKKPSAKKKQLVDKTFDGSEKNIKKYLSVPIATSRRDPLGLKQDHEPSIAEKL